MLQVVYINTEFELPMHMVKQVLSCNSKRVIGRYFVTLVDDFTF